MKYALPADASFQLGEKVMEDCWSVNRLGISKKSIPRFFIQEDTGLHLLRPLLLTIKAHFRSNGKTNMGKVAAQIVEGQRKILELDAEDQREVPVVFRCSILCKNGRKVTEETGKTGGKSFFHVIGVQQVIAAPSDGP